MNASPRCCFSKTKATFLLLRMIWQEATEQVGWMIPLSPGEARPSDRSRRSGIEVTSYVEYPAPEREEKSKKRRYNISKKREAKTLASLFTCAEPPLFMNTFYEWRV